MLCGFSTRTGASLLAGSAAACALPSKSQLARRRLAARERLGGLDNADGSRMYLENLEAGSGAPARKQAQATLGFVSDATELPG